MIKKHEALAARRKREQRRYDIAYLDENYRMGDARLKFMRNILRGGGPGDSFLDVGCGRGELLDVAREIGFGIVCGAEVVESLCGDGVVKIDGIHDLPFRVDSFKIVVCCDVLEHLLEEDAILGIEELIRVARRKILITVSWFPSNQKSFDGRDFHILKRQPMWWRNIIESCGKSSIRIIRGWCQGSALIEVDL